MAKPAPDQGVFASAKAVAAQGKEDLMRLTWATTTGSSYCARQMEKEQFSENFQEVFGIGQRRTKYMGVQLRQAPLLDRSSCRYSTDFARKPLGDHIENGKLASMFKSGSAAVKNKMPSGKPTSTYAEELCLPLTVEERLAARLPPVAYKATIGDKGARSVYTTSLAHEIYQAHPEIGMSLSAADIRPKDCLGVRSNTAPAEPMKSLYNTDFTRKETRRDRVRKKGWT
mmetsp:Transcript_21227/g.39930  ORF Transcript_21227/g.39930 Transcript_21227/m.39930 type:complete len:228 (+) Transcript_21227:111-794(+)